MFGHNAYGFNRIDASDFDQSRNQLISIFGYGSNIFFNHCSRCMPSATYRRFKRIFKCRNNNKLINFQYFKRFKCYTYMPNMRRVKTAAIERNVHGSTSFKRNYNRFLVKSPYYGCKGNSFMALKIAINGFGRIGRCVTRLIAGRDDVELSSD